MSKRHRANRNGGYNRHHVIPKSRGGHNGSDNILVIPKVDHDKYHSLFGNMTIEEAMAYLYYNYSTPEWRAKHKEIEG